MLLRRWPFALGLALALAALSAGIQQGANPTEGWLLAARWTARTGFPLFILTYSASSLLRLSPGPITRSLVRDRRWWGLGFAASHTVHLYALVTYLGLSGESRPLPVLLGGGTGYVLLYAMAFTSTNAAQRALGAIWKRLHRLGIHWLWFIFTFSYFSRVSRGIQLPYAAIALGVALVALGLRVAAWKRARR